MNCFWCACRATQLWVVTMETKHDPPRRRKRFRWICDNHEKLRIELAGFERATQEEFELYSVHHS